MLRLAFDYCGVVANTLPQQPIPCAEPRIDYTYIVNDGISDILVVNTLFTKGVK